ncbi:MAG: preprotein translocase subunit SecG [Candidatus Competibacterales bacterium]|nr:preprotein translocase subunit SecG [Candidatus Competibacterales bacterium]
MQTIFLVIHVVIALGLITLVLLQQGKGADAGTGFGGGASSTVFGSRGAATFLSRTTAMLAAGFFLSSMVLAYFATQSQGPTSVVEPTGPPAVEQPAVPEAPAESAPAPAEDVPQLPQQQ